MAKCKICNAELPQNELRLSVCWPCAEAESIIAEGIDMFDCGTTGLKNKDVAENGMEKLVFLIKKGWKYCGSEK